MTEYIVVCAIAGGVEDAITPKEGVLDVMPEVATTGDDTLGAETPGEGVKKNDRPNPTAASAPITTIITINFLSNI